jgi:hypothetical protein
MQTIEDRMIRLKVLMLKTVAIQLNHCHETYSGYFRTIYT